MLAPCEGRKIDPFLQSDKNRICDPFPYICAGISRKAKSQIPHGRRSGYSGLLVFSPCRSCYSLMWFMEENNDAVRLSKPKMAVLTVFFGFLIMSGKMRAPIQILHMVRCSIYPATSYLNLILFNVSKTFKGYIP